MPYFYFISEFLIAINSKIIRFSIQIQATEPLQVYF